MLLTGTIAYFTTDTVIEALRNLGEGLTRMRMGDYGRPIAPVRPAGDPHEFRGGQ